MQTSETRAVVQRFLEARAANDRSQIVELLTDDAEWYPPASAGFGPFRGATRWPTPSPAARPGS